MRLYIFGMLLTLLFLGSACKRQQTLSQQAQPNRQYTYYNSAFSSRPGEAWSGDVKAMLQDMKKVIAEGDYGKMPPAVGVSGFAGRLGQAAVLRPLKQPGKNGEIVYALESTACGQGAKPTPYEAIRAVFQKKYTAYKISRQQ